MEFVNYAKVWFNSSMAAFQTSMDGYVKILTISGRLDPHSGKDLKDTMQSLALGPEPEACDLMVDLENLDYMASAGFRAARSNGCLNWRVSTRRIRLSTHAMRLSASSGG